MARQMSNKTINHIESGNSFELGELGYVLKKFMSEVGEKSFNYINVGLDEAEELMLERVRAATPEGETGELAKSWVGTTRKYKGVRYITNTAEKMDKKTGRKHRYINYVEFGVKGKPFVRKAYRATENDLRNVIVKNLEKMDI